MGIQREVRVGDRMSKSATAGEIFYSSTERANIFLSKYISLLIENLGLI